MNIKDHDIIKFSNKILNQDLKEIIINKKIFTNKGTS